MEILFHWINGENCFNTVFVVIIEETITKSLKISIVDRSIWLIPDWRWFSFKICAHVSSFTLFIHGDLMRKMHIGAHSVWHVNIFSSSIQKMQMEWERFSRVSIKENNRKTDQSKMVIKFYKWMSSVLLFFYVLSSFLFTKIVMCRCKCKIVIIQRYNTIYV